MEDFMERAKVVVSVILFLVALYSAMAMIDRSLEKDANYRDEIIFGEVAEERAENVKTADFERYTAESIVCVDADRTPVAATDVKEAMPHYTVDGQRLYMDEYLWGCLEQYGIATDEIFRIALCQAFQESRFDVAAQNPNGHDKGLFQFRDIYWDEYSSAAGFGGSDILDPMAQCQVYAYHLARHLQTEDVFTAVSDHYTGGYGYSATYVHDVFQWMEKVQEEE